MENEKDDELYFQRVCGTPQDYTDYLYRIYFELGEYQNHAFDVLKSYVGEERAGSIVKLTYGYELELPIQCVPEVVNLLCKHTIAIYQVVRYAKTDGKWMV